jgi:hypothetical protein
MTKSATLYTCPAYFRSYRIEIAAEYGGCALTKVIMDAGGKTAATDEFKAVSPTGAVPALKSAEGVCLFDASAAAALVGGCALSGGDCPVARAQVSFPSTELQRSSIFLSFCPLLYSSRAFMRT